MTDRFILALSRADTDTPVVEVELKFATLEVKVEVGFSMGGGTINSAIHSLNRCVFGLTNLSKSAPENLSGKLLLALLM